MLVEAGATEYPELGSIPTKAEMPELLIELKRRSCIKRFRYGNPSNPYVQSHQALLALLDSTDVYFASIFWQTLREREEAEAAEEEDPSRGLLESEWDDTPFADAVETSEAKRQRTGPPPVFEEPVKDEKGSLYDQAVSIALTANRASVSLIQRELRIGHRRATELIEQMERTGLVSPMDAAGNRSIVLSK